MSLADDLDEEMHNAAALIDSLSEQVRKWELLALRWIGAYVEATAQCETGEECAMDALTLLRESRTPRGSVGRTEMPSAPDAMQDGELLTVWQMQRQIEGQAKLIASLEERLQQAEMRGAVTFGSIVTAPAEGSVAPQGLAPTELYSCAPATSAGRVP